MIYKTLFQILTLLFTKYHMIKRNDMHMVGYILIRHNFSMTLRFLILPSFLFTRNLRIGKNYTLCIFMLSGSIQFYSNFLFNMTCICHKIMSLISNYTHAYSFSLYKSLIISKCAFSHATNLFNSNHEIQTYTPKDVFSLQIPFMLYLGSSSLSSIDCLYESATCKEQAGGPAVVCRSASPMAKSVLVSENPFFFRVF